MKIDQNQYNKLYEDEIHELDFAAPPVHVFDDEHWFYIQRRFHLTDRELQVARLVCRGLNNDAIAAKLKIRPGTVKTHMRNLYRRIRIKNKIQMILKFWDIVAKFTPGAEKAPAIPIVEMKESAPNASISLDVPKKSNYGTN